MAFFENIWEKDENRLSIN